jgi:small conductance mechanosensitive channel
VDFDFSDLGPLGEWVLQHGTRIVLIVVLAFVAYRTFHMLAGRLRGRIQRLDGEDGTAFDKRAQTIFKVINNAALVAITVAASLMILDEAGVEIGPLLASVGIVGLALGLGAQTLVQDVISGLFLLIENQYTVGDIVELNGRVGVVEDVTLRVTSVRDVEGVLHTIPNGEIRIVSNRSRDWSRAIVDVGIAYEDDVALAQETLLAIGRNLMSDPQLRLSIVEEPTVTGIEDLEEWRVRLRVMVKTLPAQQLEVQRQLRAEIKRVFPEKGLSLATPRQEIVILNEAPAPDARYS